MSASVAPRPLSFAPLDWALLLGTGLMWGSSFLLIAIGLADFPPATVTWFRLLLGAATLALFPGARKALAVRRDWGLIAVLGIIWMAVPLSLFPIAQQTIDSSLAGMINGSTPLFTAVFAVLFFQGRPTRPTVVGLVVGFLGVVTIAAPSLSGGATAAAVAMTLGASLCYGMSFNLTGALQARNGALAVIFRAMAISVVLTTPAGVAGLVGSEPSGDGIAAMAVLGVASTGIGFAAFTHLVGRVGAPRASVTTYLQPAVALLLGVLVLGEVVHPLALVGVVLVLGGAFLTSRGRRPAAAATGRDPEMAVKRNTSG